MLTIVTFDMQKAAKVMIAICFVHLTLNDHSNVHKNHVHEREALQHINLWAVSMEYINYHLALAVIKPKFNVTVEVDMPFWQEKKNRL